MARLDQLYTNLGVSFGGDCNRPQFALNLVDLNRDNDWQCHQNFRAYSNRQCMPAFGFADNNPYVIENGSPAISFGIKLGNQDYSQNFRTLPKYEVMPQVVFVDNNQSLDSRSYRQDAHFAVNPFKHQSSETTCEKLPSYQFMPVNLVENKQIAVGNGKLTESIPTKPGSCEGRVESFESGDKPPVKFQRVDASPEALEQRLGRALKPGECAWSVTNGGGNRSNGFNDKTFIGTVTYDEKRHGVLIDVAYPVKQRILYKDNGTVEHQFPHQAKYTYKPKTTQHSPYEPVDA